MIYFEVYRGKIHLESYRCTGREILIERFVCWCAGDKQRNGGIDRTRSGRMDA